MIFGQKRNYALREQIWYLQNTGYIGLESYYTLSKQDYIDTDMSSYTQCYVKTLSWTSI